MTLHDTRLCAVEDCQKPAVRQGWCPKHYGRWFRHGDPLALVGRANLRGVPDTERFLAYAGVSVDGGCREWSAGRTQFGYGKFTIGKQIILAHRYAWTLASGEPIPDGFDVLHVCDNPPCTMNDGPGTYVVRGIVRPRYGHLWLGTNADNTADRQDKGRSANGDRAGLRVHPERAGIGERNGRALLTAGQVDEIRALHAERGWGKVRLSRLYPVSQAQIGRILRGESW